MKFNSHIQNLTTYEAGKPIELVVREFGILPQDVIKLASNENPLGVSPQVAAKICEVAKNASLYPDDSYFELKDALAAKHNANSKNFIIGSGSDQVIEFLIHAKCNSQCGILTAGVTFAMYEIYAKSACAPVFKTPSKEHKLSEFKEILAQNSDKIGIVFLCVPNNPLGECLDKAEILDFIKTMPKDVLVVIDGAYSEFARFKDASKALVPSDVLAFENAVFLGTFSKAYGLGGMRVGYGVANEEVIRVLHKVRAPFNITTLSLAAAIEALKDENFINLTLKNNFEQMVRYEEFAKTHNLEFIPSYTNFITIFCGEKNSTTLCQNLLQKGVILRNLQSYGLNAVRITIGQSWQNDRVLHELAKEFE